MAVLIIDTLLDPLAVLAAHQPAGDAAKIGALATFTGFMRDINEGDAVRAMHLEHYPGMTERSLEKLCDEATERWDLLDVLVVHRVGALLPTDPIVLVAAWSSHRGAALDACRFLIEALKSRAPFWKRETLTDGTRWVAHNTPDNPV